MEPVVSHQHTFFLFPFSVDRDVVLHDHGALWAGRRWIDGLDDWIRSHDAQAPSVGRWQRAAYTQFGLDSPAYQDMVFFHPFVRRIYFDALGMNAGEWEGEEMGGEGESLLRFYRLPVAGKKVTLHAEDKRGRRAQVDLTDLRLILFANGIGILSIGVEAMDLPAKDALWINEMFRKLYPSSSRQVREGRTPCLLRLCVDGETLIEEDFRSCGIRNYLPPISQIIRRLLYFSQYESQEYEAVLDERMIVYTYLSIDPRSVPADYKDSDEYQVFVSRALYVDNLNEGYRYQPDFLRRQMIKQLYRRWAHQGTYYGATSYSNITISFGQFDCDDHQLREGFLIHRMFTSRYYLMALIALFYRATLLDFAETTALVTRRLYHDFQDQTLSPDNIDLADTLRYEYLTFSNYWHFHELANKDEEAEHFDMQCDAYRIDPMKAEIGEEIERLNGALNEYYQKRNTQAVNRLAMLSMILGGGAVLTGFFGMNFGQTFEKVFFQPNHDTLAFHWTAVAVVSLVAFGALLLGIYVILGNWSDYRDSLFSRRRATDIDRRRLSVKRVQSGVLNVRGGSS
jgi:hypothetical protein